MLKDTLLKFLKLDSLIENITGYVEARIELMKIEIKEEVAKGISKALVLVVVLAVLMMAVLMISMAAAYKIGDAYGMFEGFGIVACFYLVVGVLIFLFRKPIASKLEERLDEKMTKRKGSNGDDRPE